MKPCCCVEGANFITGIGCCVENGSRQGDSPFQRVLTMTDMMYIISCEMRDLYAQLDKIANLPESSRIMLITWLKGSV